MEHPAVSINTQRAWVSFRKISFWFILASLAAISLLHYLTDIHLIPYHSIYRSLYYVPIAVGAVRYGRRGGIATALTASLLYLPHVVLSWGITPSGAFNDLMENAVFLFVGAFAGSLADAERVQRERAQEAARQLSAANSALTQQMELSERMRVLLLSILESIDSGVITLDASGQVTTCNPSAHAILGEEVTHVKDMPGFLQQYVERGGRNYQTEIIENRTYGLHATPLIGLHQEAVGTVLILDDITEQRALEEQVQRVQRLSALGRLAGGLAHEIRNPLGIARAAAQMLAHQFKTDSQLAEYTQVIQSEIDRVDRLIEQLLAYARPTVVHRGRVDIGELVTRTVTLAHAYAAQQQVQLEAEIAPQLPFVDGDTELLHQALVNLVLNAIQATPPRGKVCVSAALDASTLLPCMQLTVADTGQGIAAGDRARIFDPFFTTRDDGTGLGLSIVQQIVQEHDGTITVTSEVGSGTQFVLRLPLLSARRSMLGGGDGETGV